MNSNDNNLCLIILNLLPEMRESEYNVMEADAALGITKAANSSSTRGAIRYKLEFCSGGDLKHSLQIEPLRTPNYRNGTVNSW